MYSSCCILVFLHVVFLYFRTLEYFYFFIRDSLYSCTLVLLYSYTFIINAFEYYSIPVF